MSNCLDRHVGFQPEKHEDVITVLYRLTERPSGKSYVLHLLQNNWFTFETKEMTSSWGSVQDHAKKKHFRFSMVQRKDKWLPENPGDKKMIHIFRLFESQQLFAFYRMRKNWTMKKKWKNTIPCAVLEERGKMIGNLLADGSPVM